MTTLEEVFLRVGHGDDSNKDQEELAKIKQLAKDKQSLLNTPENDYSISSQPKLPFCRQFGQHMAALFLKRFYVYRRNLKGLLTEVFVPVLLVLIGFAFSKVQFFFSQPSRTLAPGLYPTPQRVSVNQDLAFKPSWGTNLPPAQVMSALPTSGFNISYVALNHSTDPWMTDNVTFDNLTYSNRLQLPYSPYRYGSFYVYEADNKSMNFQAAVWLNLTSQDVAAIYPEFMYESFLQAAVPGISYKVTTTPYPVTQKLKQRAASASGLFTAFVVSIGFAIIPAVVVAFVLNEREKNLKHIQVISGMSLTAYWVSNLLFDILKGLIPSAIVIGFSYAFSLNVSYSRVIMISIVHNDMGDVPAVPSGRGTLLLRYFVHLQI